MNILLGKTLSSISGLSEGSYFVEFKCSTKERFQWCSSDGPPNDCNVYISQIIGDVSDLLNSPILQAEIKTNINEGLDPEYTWTFFTLATIKGYVDVIWQGSSNGFYSDYPEFFYDGKEGL